MKTSFLKIRLWLPAVVFGLAAPFAHAAFSPSFVNATADSSGTTFTYSLNLNFTGSPRALETNISRLVVFDIPGFVSATAGSGFSVTNQNVGPGMVAGDDATLSNLIFTFTGNSTTASTVFTGFTVISTSSSLGSLDYSSKFWNQVTGSTTYESGLVTTPSPTIQSFRLAETVSNVETVPEGGLTAGLLGASLICLVGLRRRLS